MLPILARRPCLVVGIPVAFAILRLAADMPVALFQLNDSPGMPVFDLRLVIWHLHLFACFRPPWFF